MQNSSEYKISSDLNDVHLIIYYYALLFQNSMGKSVLHVGQDSLSQSQYPIELMIQESGQEEKVVRSTSAVALTRSS